MIPFLFLSMAAAQVPAAAPTATGGENPKQTIDMYFAALNRHDGTKIAEVTVPDGNLTALTNGKDGATKVRHTTWALFLQSFAKDTVRRHEKVSPSTVYVDGDFAMAWNFYTYAADGRFSHCGTNHIDLIRRDGRWKILNLTWTESRTGCKVR